MLLRPRILIFSLALLFSALAQIVMSATESLYWLHPWALAPGFYVLCRLNPKQAAFAGWIMGFVANLGIFYWVPQTATIFGNLPYVLSIGVLGLLAASMGLGLALFGWGLGFIRRASRSFWPFAAAAWFVACEFITPQLFPYQHGISLHHIPEIFLVVSVTGIYGLSFQIILCNLILVAIFEHYRGISRLNHRVWLGSIAAVVAMLAVDLSVSSWQEARIHAAEAKASALRVAIVQPNLGILDRRKLGPKGVAQAHVRQSQESLASDPEIDIFVWGEGALRKVPQHPENAVVSDFLKAVQRELWTGGRGRDVTEDGRRRRYNSAYILDEDGVRGRYDKIRLLPFGEYIPFADSLPILYRLPITSNFSPGEKITAFDSSNTVSVAFLICYEAILREFVRTGLPSKTNLIVNLTYDAWFGDTSAPAQHLMMAAARSAELGIPMVRAAATGISAFVDARGVITQRSNAFEKKTLVAEVRPLRVPTFYGAVGDWFAWSATVVAILMLALGFFQSRKT